MIRDFFIKKENVFIIIVGCISIFFAVLGFLFLFLRDTSPSDGPRVIPSNIFDITWDDFKSNLLGQKIQYPEYMYIAEQKDLSGVGLTIAEFEPREFLTYFSNQEHVSFYPNGIDVPFFYGKTKESDFTSSSNQEYVRTEYLTLDNEVWAVMLVPKNKFEEWQNWGFIWIQTKIVGKEENCITEKGAIIDGMTCNEYQGERVVYSGKISDRIIKVGYEIVNQNTFK